MSAQPKIVNQLKGKKVVVIGGTSGIGFATASALIEEGASVVVASSSQERVQKAIDRLSDPKQQYNADSSRVSGQTVNLSGSEVEDSLNTFFSKVGKFDHLSYTSGDSLSISSVENLSYQSIVKTFEVRLISAILATKAAVVGGYLQDGGSITLTTGMVAESPIAGWSAVAAGSAAHWGLVKNLAFDLSPKNIRVNAVSPGPVKTELWEGFPQELKQKMMETSLTHDVGTPVDLAQTYLYLLKDTNITGEVINSNGGSRFGPGPKA